MTRRVPSLAQGGHVAILILWLAGAVVTWNMVFDAHIVQGARDYVDRQEAFTEERGPRQDMARSMADAGRRGLRAASLWTAAELASGAILLFVLHRRRRPGI